ncbi:MAG: cell division protein FtsA [Candidatus Hydrogenedens sp.]|nr:cell division protein FtsA [Candidatus Hydrogenedens sp.]
MARRGDIVGAVDFGSRDVRVLIGQKGYDGAITILGHGMAPGRGCVMQGVIQDHGAAQRALKQALVMAEKEAGTKVPKLICGMNGSTVESHIREGRAQLDKESVDLRHMEEALEMASRNILAPGKKVCSSISSQEWYVDDMRVSDPIGIRGSVLKTRVHFALLPSVIEDNINTVVESQGREVEDVIYVPIAGAMGCLTPEDMELGVCVVDMGRSTCGISIYRDRRILQTHSFEWGGFHITRDVAAGLQISFEEALELILEYGIAESLLRQMSDSNVYQLEGTTGRAFAAEREQTAHIKLKSAVRGAPSVADRYDLEMIIFERAKELMNAIYDHLDRKNHLDNLIRGIVLIGGSAGINNMDALATSVFQAPARVGVPDGIDVLPPHVASPEWVPGVGMLKHGFDYRDAVRSGRIERQRGFVGGIFHGIGGFFGKYFF